MIKLENFFLDYEVSARERNPAFANVNAEFPAEEISVILGPSGCGKTSLLHTMAGLITPSAGKILIHGKPIDGTRPSTAVIFQDFGLLPWKTVVANAELPLKIMGMKKKQRREMVIPLLKDFGLEKSINLYPAQLSGGMKQRLAIARSFASGPDLLLMDEPFSSLDALSREDAQDFLLELSAKRNITIIMVTHSIEEAVYLADTIYVMKGKNPGTIHQSIEIPDRNKKTFRNDVRFQEYCALIRNIIKCNDAVQEYQHE